MVGLSEVKPRMTPKDAYSNSKEKRSDKRTVLLRFACCFDFLLDLRQNRWKVVVPRLNPLKKTTGIPLRNVNTEAILRWENLPPEVRHA